MPTSTFITSENAPVVAAYAALGMLTITAIGIGYNIYSQAKQNEAAEKSKESLCALIAQASK